MRLFVRSGKFRRWAFGLAMGGTVLQLGSCSPDVRNALLTGLQTTLTTFSTTLIQTFFLVLQNTRLPTTQQVQIIVDHAQRVLA